MIMKIGIVNEVIINALKKRKKIKVIKRYLYMYYKINIGLEAIKKRYERFKVSAGARIQ